MEGKSPRATGGGAMSQDDPLLEKVFSDLHVQLAVFDGEFNFVRVNRAYAEAAGYDPEYFTGKNHFALYPHEENEAIWTRVRDTGIPFVAHERPFRYPDYPERGTTWWDWSFSPLEDAGGVPDRFLLCLVDVTRLKRAERSLTESEAAYRAVVEQASDGILVLDREGTILEANLRACDLSGYSAKELAGRGIEALEDGGEGDRVAGIARMLEGETVVGECVWRRKDGSQVPVELSGSMLADGRLMVIGRDVSARREAQDKMLAFQECLRRLSSELSLAEERTRRRIAKDLHDQVGQMLALCQMKLGELQQQSTGDGARSVKEIRGYLYDVIVRTRSLTFELGSPVLYELGLEAALEELVKEASKRYGLRVEFVDDGGEKPLNHDMRSVLFRSAGELLANAAKHAAASSVRVALSARDGLVVMTVGDDGKGFDAEHFTARVTRGGGFGLFSMRERLEYLGGSLKIDSSPGRGTSVSVALPLSIGAGKKGDVTWRRK